MSTPQELHSQYEPHPDPSISTANTKTDNISDVDYEPYPAKSLPISPAQSAIITHITNLYSGSASEDDMHVYSPQSIYDDPLSYCKNRYEIAGQWYGIPKLFSPSKTLKTEVVKAEPQELVFKLQQQYTLVGIHVTKVVNSLVSLTMDEEGKVKYHKDMWNEKDYSHDGFGKAWKNLNGSKLTAITKPPKDL